MQSIGVYLKTAAKPPTATFSHKGRESKSGAGKHTSQRSLSRSSSDRCHSDFSIQNLPYGVFLQRLATVGSIRSAWNSSARRRGVSIERIAIADSAKPSFVETRRRAGLDRKSKVASIR